MFGRQQLGNMFASSVYLISPVGVPQALLRSKKDRVVPQTQHVNLRMSPEQIELSLPGQPRQGSTLLSHKSPFVGVSEACSWSHWLVFVNIWQESPSFPERSVKIDF